MSLQLTRRSLSTNRVLLDPALLVLRAVLGVTMFAHGWQKLTGPGLEGVGGMFDQMGVPLASTPPTEGTSSSSCSPPWRSPSSSPDRARGRSTPPFARRRSPERAREMVSA
ncbi:DoxX family protein [Janibacter sp. Y6]|uniref:DoxX family protein n=1 Tax=Janibacter sp. Y6 TaxID=2913552 RepID=UPI0034A4B0EB